MRRLFAIATLLALLAACGEQGAPAGSTTSAPGDEGGFELEVQPVQYFPVMPGQLFVVLVSPNGGEGPVLVTASVTGAATVAPDRIEVDPGAVAEIALVARPGSAGTSLDLELRAVRGAQEEVRSLAIEVVDWVDDIQPLATELRDRFVAYLETTHPELGITSETEWSATITKPQILVVMHYLFFSDEWEMAVTWHVTVPEHAWSRMYLRPRDELLPTLGLEIPTYLDPTSTPVPWAPPAEIDR